MPGCFTDARYAGTCGTSPDTSPFPHESDCQHPGVRIQFFHHPPAFRAPCIPLRRGDARRVCGRPRPRPAAPGTGTRQPWQCPLRYPQSSRCRVPDRVRPIWAGSSPPDRSVALIQESWHYLTMSQPYPGSRRRGLWWLRAPVVKWQRVPGTGIALTIVQTLSSPPLRIPALQRSLLLP
jgi:hypothetical protein